MQATLPTESGRTRAIKRFRVQVIAGPAAGEVWAEAAERCSIGSHRSNDLVIDDPTVSRFHCELSIVGSNVRARDLGSLNRIIGDSYGITDATIPDGAVLALGSTRIRVDIDTGIAEVPASPLDRFGSLVGARVARTWTGT